MSNKGGEAYINEKLTLIENKPFTRTECFRLLKLASIFSTPIHENIVLLF